TKKTAFRHLNRVRLVIPCRDAADYEQYVLKEFQLYRVQRLLTPFSLEARMARVSYVDADKKDTLQTRLGFLLEDEDDFAARIGGRLETIKGATGADLEPEENAFFGV